VTFGERHFKGALPPGMHTFISLGGLAAWRLS
jgi:hypothetical protein